MKKVKVVIKTSNVPNATDVFTVDKIKVNGVDRTNDFDISDLYFTSDVEEDVDDLFDLKLHIANVLGVNINDIDFTIQHN